MKTFVLVGKGIVYCVSQSMRDIVAALKTVPEEPWYDGAGRLQVGKLVRIEVWVAGVRVHSLPQE